MGKVAVLLVCSFYVLLVQCGVKLDADQPSVRAEIDQQAVLRCCFWTTGNPDLVWSKRVNKTQGRYYFQKDSFILQKIDDKNYCGVLNFTATIADRGFYQCFLNESRLWTHGTYLQVFKPLEKTIPLRPGVKDAILTVEGVLLFLCVILPSATLLFKSKNLNNQEKRKMKKEEENIYQGLDLDDCCAAYDQIERLQGEGPYQDVINNGEDIQLEKP